MGACGGRRGEGNDTGMLPRGRTHAGSLVLRVFISLSGRNVRGGFQQNIHRFFRRVLLGSWSLLIVQCQGRRLLVIVAGPGFAYLVWLLLWAWS